MTAPTEEQREFLTSHRLVIVGVERDSGPPSLSPSYYVMDGQDMLISTTSKRQKARSVRRNPEITLCVLDESFPFPYLTVYGKGAIDDDPAAALDVIIRIRERVSGKPLDEAGRKQAAETVEQEGRVALRVTPERFFSTPARAGQRRS